ncbi:cation:proton antiporter [Cyanobacterium stanieri LEGE 03274]|uniref:Cation:proton antiporter n=1 Tax=Cyanobacterium stanieri LEGE 03274 TaxID=1828756 RepID=A0ABR9V1M9_9CHRO|nr:cation:proton antiporter [Cyanobacterium stanieri]MBE9221446.1 cation:proton antiporter [Cyanobacterium stanieri LEGE 03274]
MENLLTIIPDSPIVTFTILLLIILTVPPIFEKIKLPGLVGLLVAGVVFGNDGLGLLNAENESVKLLADIGKIYLMFVAGLEIDLVDFRKSRNRALGFGVFTFIFPLIVGTGVGLFFDMGLNASVLIGSLLASHTLLAYPIVNGLGVVGNEAVVVTIGATIVTDTAALLILAICISIHGGDFSLGSLIVQLVSLGIYSLVVLYGFDRVGKEYFRRTGDEQSNQFLFVLFAVFLASVGAQLINIDIIVGAFLAGLAVNDVVGEGPVKEKIEFVGSTLFIPCFFVSMGLLLNISSFATTLTNDLPLTVAIVVGLFVGKFLAAIASKVSFKYNWDQCLTMWSLSLPQVAATLAATLAGVRAGLLSESVFNAVIVLMLATSLAGPILTKKFAGKLKTAQIATTPATNLEDIIEATPEKIAYPEGHDKPNNLFKVIIPIHNPSTEKFLIEMGAILAKHEAGMIIPLCVAKAHIHMDEPELNFAIAQGDKLISRAMKYSQELNVTAKPIIRIDDDVAQGISRSARENDASLILMGWTPITTIQARLFGNLIDNVFWSSHCPVAVVNLLDEPSNIRSILVPVKNIDLKIIKIIRFAAIFAEMNQGSLTLLHVHDRKATRNEINLFQNALQETVAPISHKIDITIKTLRYQDPAEAIVHTANKYDFDLVMLRSVRRRTAGGLAVSDVTTQTIKKLKRSVILLGEPH